MQLNPLHLLDTLLHDYASPRVRRGIHTGILLVLSLFAIWQGVDGDWRQFIAALGVLLYAGANRANTAPPEDVSGNLDEDEVYEDEGYPGDPVD